MILLDPKKILSFIVDVINAYVKGSQECYTDLQVLEGRVTFVSVCNEMHMRCG